jgi:High potential iron-sulfur protein
MKDSISRRAIVKVGLLASVAVPLFELTTRDARAAALTPLDPADPLAKSLAFVTDATKVNPSANPTYKPAQKCGNCAQFQGKPTDASAACTIFAGHSVPAGGWCKVWAQKPGT